MTPLIGAVAGVVCGVFFLLGAAVGVLFPIWVPLLDRLFDKFKKRGRA